MPRTPRNPQQPDQTGANDALKYLSYEDLPPPSPEERELLKARIEKLYHRAHQHYERERREALLRWVDFAP